MKTSRAALRYAKALLSHALDHKSLEQVAQDMQQIVEQINQQNEIGIDTAKNFEYDNIKTLDVKKSITPNPNQIQPTDKDIKKGWMERYFAKKVNDDIILELTKEDFDNVGTENGLDKILWKKFKLRWRITGPIDEILQTNQQTIQIKSQDYPLLSNLITDFTEFV